jgi:starch phosphorylase
VHRANLSVVGSHCVNGVSKIHTELLKNEEMKDFNQVFPKKFTNVTNGITHRRWLMQANPALTCVINDAIGTRWVKEPDHLIDLLKYAKDPSMQAKIAEVKNHNKILLAQHIWESNGVKVDPNSIFDVQIKRLHLYKRQLLNVLHIMDLYSRLIEDPDLDIVPQTFIFAAKSAPGYLLSKKIIKLINTVAKCVNQDKLIQDKLKVVFLENYRVTLAEKIIPASEISEQISTATKEASGTGNMKLMMNGALTLGTLDGATIEINNEVGDDNIFIFGLHPEDVLNYYAHGGYSAIETYNEDKRIKRVLDKLINGFLPDSESEFQMIHHFLLSNNDEFFVLKDFEAYAQAQTKVNMTYQDKSKWQEMSITNIAHSGKFSSDRTISEYARSVWKINPFHIK